MARIKIPKGTKFPDFWSVSRYNVWRECARKYLLKHVLKYPEPKHPAAERGIHHHHLLEQYLKGGIRGMPDELKNFKKEINEMKRLGARAEESWTLTKDLKQTHAKDWNNAWLRAKVDIHHFFEDDGTLLIVDYKTGKIKPFTMQKELYAWMGTLYYPQAEKIEVELWFGDQNETDQEEYEAHKARNFRRKWIKRAESMLSDRSFRPSPGSACNYCPYRSDTTMPNGEKGPCDDWKKRTD